MIVGARLEVVAISNATSTESGQTAVLVCVGYGNFLQVTWSRSGQVLANTSAISIYEEELVQGGRTFTQSFLQLCSVQLSDAGNYTCSVSNGRDSVRSDVQLSVTSKQCCNLLIYRTSQLYQVWPTTIKSSIVKSNVA